MIHFIYERLFQEDVLSFLSIFVLHELLQVVRNTYKYSPDP